MPTLHRRLAIYWKGTMLRAANCPAALPLQFGADRRYHQPLGDTHVGIGDLWFGRRLRCRFLKVGGPYAR